MDATGVDRLIGYARLDSNYGDAAIQEAKRCIELGLVGIKLHPKTQQFHINDPTVYKIAEHVADVSPDIPIIFDNGKPASPNKLIGDLADVFPDLTFILAHMRGSEADGLWWDCHKSTENLTCQYPIE